MKKAREYMVEFASWVDTNERAKKGIVVLQVIAVACGVLTKLYPAYEVYFVIGFFTCILPVLISSTIVLIFYTRFDLNLLYYDKQTGHLYDENLRIHNVALRRTTVDKILSECHNQDPKKLAKLGEGIGREFVTTFRSTPGAAAPKDQQELLKKLLRYDSSSGMGRFDQVDQDLTAETRWIKVQVRNPFTTVGATDSVISPFLQGYISGLVSESYGLNFQPSAWKSHIDHAIKVYEITLTVRSPNG